MFSIYLSKQDSLILKGIALLMLLCHHLFYPTQMELFDDYSIPILNQGVVLTIGMCSKICVAIFVFLSGYGLTVSAQEKEQTNYFDYFKRRVLKLFPTYWLIWILFVPITVFATGRSLESVYGDNIVSKLILDILGLLNFTGEYGYNPTWWFMSCIIGLYLLFPFLYKLAKKSLLALFVISYVLYLGVIPCISCVTSYILPFSIAIIASLTREQKVQNEKKIYKSILCVIMTLLIGRLLLLRVKTGNTIEFDWAICTIMIMLYCLTRFPKWLNNILMVIGKHSMNIFLFHTFLFEFWFRKTIYITSNPTIIFLELLIISLLFSVVLEKIKAVFHIPRT